MGKVSLLQDSKVVLEVKSGQHAIFYPKLGKKYQLVQDALGKHSQLSNIVAIKRGANLVLLMPDNTSITIENFYLECAANQCSVETNQVTITTRSGAAGPATGDNSLVFAQGDNRVLQEMAQGNPMLSDAISRYISTHNTSSPSGIESIAKNATPQMFDSVSSVVGGPGAGLLLLGAGAAGVAAAAGGGGGSGGGSSGGGTSNNTQTVNITSASTLSLDENQTSVATLKANKSNVSWSFDTTGEAANYADNNLFDINSTTGALTFKSAPDFENSAHAQQYKVQVKASYSYATSAFVLKTATDIQAFTINVKDVVNEFRPSLSLNSAINNGATQQEATDVLFTLTAINQNNNNASIQLPNNYKAVITFTQGKNVVVKEVTGTGNPLTVFLTSAEITKLGDGTVTISAVSKDSAGNTSASATSSFRLDTRAPNLNASATLNLAENLATIQSMTSNESVTWSLDISGTDAAQFADNNKVSIDSATGLLTWNSANVPDFETPSSSNSSNIYKIALAATDTAGNKSIQNLTVNITNVVNESTPTLSLNNTYVIGNISKEEALDSRGLFSLSNVPSGNTARITIRDSAGNSIVKTAASTGAAITIALSDSDIGQLLDGRISVTAVNIDSSSNISNPSSIVSFTLDKSIPSILGNGTISANEGSTSISTLNASESVTWSLDSNGTDASAYADNGLFSINSSGVLSWANGAVGDFALRGNNPYRLRVLVSDSAGNSSAQNMTLLLQDVAGLKTAPSLALTNLVSGNVGNDEALNPMGFLQISNADVNQSVRVTLSNGSGNTVIKTIAAVVANKSYLSLNQADLTALGNGSVTISAISYDSNGNSSAKSSNLITTLDSSAPVISSANTVSMPENVNTVLTVTATDNSAITWSLDRSGSDASLYADNSLFNINSNGVVTWLSGVGRDFEASTKSATSNNSYRLRIAATDSAGNKTTQNIQVTLSDSNENPSITSNFTSTTVTSGVDSALPDIVISDPDSSDTIFVRLSTTACTITIPNAAGLTNVGSGTNSVTINGSLEVVNQALKQATINTTVNGTISIAYGDNSTGLNNLPFTSSLSVTAINAPIITGFSAIDAVGNTSQGIADQSLSFIVDFSQAISVVGTPTLVFQVGSNTNDLVTASYVSGSGSATLTFKADNGAPIASNGTLKLTRVNTDASNTLKNGSTEVSTSIVNQTGSYIVDNVAPSIGFMTKEYHARNLLITSSSSARTEAEAYKVLDSYFADASNHDYFLTASQLQTFANLAGFYNTDSSKATGGEYLGSGYWAAPSVYVTDYSLAMTTLQIGQMTATPVKTQFGWHFIYLQEVREVASNDSGLGINLRVWENTSATQKIATYTSSESTAVWSLEGTDASLFTINNGELRFITGPNFEAPADSGADNTYNLAVVLTDLAGNISKRHITVSVSNDIVGEISASVSISGATNNQAGAGTVLTASQTQTTSGGEASSLTASWQWQKQGLDNLWQDIDQATSSTYTVGNIQDALAVRSVATYQASNGQVMRAYSSPISVAIAPTLNQALEDVLVKSNTNFNWTLPSNSFTDFDPLTYSVTGLTGTGLNFDAATRSISGTFSGTTAVNVTLTATDSTSLSVNDSFTITPVTAPFISSFSVTDNVATQKAGASGEALTIVVRFSEAMTVASGSTLNFQVGSNASHTFSAVYTAGSGSNSVTFTATNGAPASSEGRIKLLGLSGGTITATSGGAALSSNFNQVDNSYLVDNSAPTATVALTSANGKDGFRAASALKAGDSVIATVKFNEDIMVYGAPTLSLQIGGSVGYATLQASDSSSKQLSFAYTIPSGYTDSDGIAISGINYNGGSIKNMAGISFAGSLTAANNAQFAVDTTAPTTPILTLDSNLTNNSVNYTEALTAGLIKVNGINSGDSVDIILTRSSNNSKVLKTLTGTGSELSISLSPLDIAMLGNGTINVSAVSKDAAGNTSTSANRSFTLDTLAPSSPLVSLAQGISDGASNSEAKSATGVLNFLAESGSTINISLTHTGQPTITKTLSGTGSNTPLVLNDADLTGLGTGLVNVSATATDAAGNTSLASLISFNIII